MQAQTLTRPTLANALWPDSGAAMRILRFVVLALVGSALLALSAKVKVPFYPVPVTMQTFAVLVIGAAYGWRLGATTVLLYIAEGAMGLPVFTNTPPDVASPAYLLGPTGGYIVGFTLGAALTGFLAERGWDRSLPRLFVAMALGHLVIFLFGIGWLTQLIGFEKAWAGGVAPFYAATLLKTALGAVVMPAAWALLAKKDA